MSDMSVQQELEHLRNENRVLLDMVSGRTCDMMPGPEVVTEVGGLHHILGRVFDSLPSGALRDAMMQDYELLAVRCHTERRVYLCANLPRQHYPEWRTTEQLRGRFAPLLAKANSNRAQQRQQQQLQQQMMDQSRAMQQQQQMMDESRLMQQQQMMDQARLAQQQQQQQQKQQQQQQLDHAHRLQQQVRSDLQAFQMEQWRQQKTRPPARLTTLIILDQEKEEKKEEPAPLRREHPVPMTPMTPMTTEYPVPMTPLPGH